MTGWRIGFAAGPADIINGMSKIQSHTTSNACSIAQKAALEAFGGPQYEVQRMVSEFQRRRNYVLMKLHAVPGISCFKPQGAFYLFPNVKSTFDKEADGRADPQLLRHGLLPSETGPGGHRARRRLRGGRLHPSLLRHLHGEPGEGHGPHHQGPGEAQDREKDQARGLEQHGHQGQEVRAR